MKTITMRERMLAVMQGRPHDRVPFIQYDNTSEDNEIIWQVIGRENMGVWRWSRLHAIDHPNCKLEVRRYRRNGLAAKTRILHTPAGHLTEEILYQPDLNAGCIRKHFVKDAVDYRILLAYLRDSRVRMDLRRYRRDLAELGDDGLPLPAVSRTPYQQLWVQWVCIEDLAAHLVDCPEVMEEVTAELMRVERQVYAVVRRAAQLVPLPMIDVPDNITAPVIGPKNFRKYCLPMYNELAEMLADAGTRVYVHMDGDLKPLWKLIGESRVGGIDSLSPPPDNDTSVGQAHALWPDMRLCPNFPSSVHLAEPEGIYAMARQILDEAGHSGRLQIQVSENVPPGRWRVSYPEIVGAIRDFGAP
jgi:hypothetical protein